MAINFIRQKKESPWRKYIFDNLYAYLPQFQNKRYRKLAIETLLRDGDYEKLKPLSSRLSNNARTLSCYSDSDKLVQNGIANLIEEYSNIPDDFDDIDIIQYFEIQNLLSGYLLNSQGDRVSMANSVEGRYPYLDIEFIRYVMQIPRSHKLAGTSFKHILRQAFRNSLPSEIIDAPKVAYQAPEARAILNNVGIVDSLKIKIVISMILLITTNSNV